MSVKERPSAEIVAEMIIENPELQKLQSQHLGQTLMNLIAQPTPKQAIRRRPGRGGEYPYIPTSYAIPWLNALFGGLWDVIVVEKGVVEEKFEVEEEVIPEGMDPKEVGKLRIRRQLEKVKTSVVEETQVWVWGYLSVKIPGKTVTETEFQLDGVTLKKVTETRIDPIVITKTAFGGVDIKRWGDKSDNAGMMIDLADDYKSAIADMLKKAGSYLGLWSDVYGVRELIEEKGPKELQLSALYRRAESKGLDEAKTKALCQKTFQCDPDGLNADQYLNFMRQLLGIIKPEVVKVLVEV